MDEKIKNQMQKIGRVIKSRRIEKGRKQVELAESVGISIPVVGYMEKATHATKIDSLLSVCNELGLNVEVTKNDL
jgi:transcriptional regulator with XRE-family HTH domain